MTMRSPWGVSTLMEMPPPVPLTWPWLYSPAHSSATSTLASPTGSLPACCAMAAAAVVMRAARGR